MDTYPVSGTQGLASIWDAMVDPLLLQKQYLTDTY